MLPLNKVCDKNNNFYFFDNDKNHNLARGSIYNIMEVAYIFYLMVEVKEVNLEIKSWFTRNIRAYMYRLIIKSEICV